MIYVARRTSKTKDMANIEGNISGCGQKRVVQRMWPEEGNMIDVARKR